ncbi:MAG: flippase-like domain-containing protein [Phycisphaerae bacterium]|nr:flippase-like domain-containing protein [Phycisphaerae bacterium]
MRHESNQTDRTTETTSTPRSVAGSWIGKLVSLGVSIAILAILWYSASQKDLLGSLGEIDLGYLALAVVLMPMAMVVRSVRLDTILAHSGRRLGLVRAMIVTFVGTSLNILLPSNLGDVAKAYYGYRFNLAKEVVLSVVIIDKAFGMIAAMSLGLVAATAEGLWEALALGALVSSGLIVLVFVPRLIPWRLMAWVLRKTLGKHLAHERALEASRLPLRIKMAALGLSWIACLLAYTQYYVLCRALGLAVPLTYVYAAAPLMDLAKVVPLTANGLGTREAVAVYFLGRIGVPSGPALVSSLLYTAVSLWAPALVGAPFVWLAIRSRTAKAIPTGPSND